jgi:hypothetical protein
MLFVPGSSRPELQLTISEVGLLFYVLLEGMAFNSTALFKQF